MKKTTIWALIIGIIIILIGAYLLTRGSANNLDNSGQATTNNATSTDQTTAKPVDKEKTVIGQSVGGKDIVAYHYGTGKTELLFVGGFHGGYGWNTALVSYQLMDYLKANPSVIPQNLKVTIIPVLNPDGLNKAVGTTGVFTLADVSTNKELLVASRLNDSSVDINRNFDCDWQSSAVWQKTKVSGGSKAFSEPESQALKSYVETNNPKAVVAWYSQAGGVFASQCDNGILPETATLAKTFADASGYKYYDTFDYYETTGDAVNWLAKKGIPAFSVLLTTHDDTEWSKNQAGILALFKSYSK